MAPDDKISRIRYSRNLDMAKNNVKKPVSATEKPPVVVIMGHIDHGKSTLLDYIRKSNITKHEAGGITQHLGAYEVIHRTADGKEKSITFLDTPGHEAFSGIRSRGANVADIAILVVSAEEGVKPQTLEALAQIKEAKVPFIVAMNKIDKPEANLERTKQNLAEHEIYLEGYGGDVPGVPVSAITGKGVPELLDMILLVAELEELKANLGAPATGTVIEAKLDSKKGVSATLLIQDGTLRSGMYVIAGSAYSPVRIFENSIGKNIKEAFAGSPVKVIGFNKIPEVGAPFTSVESKKDAERMAEEATAPRPTVKPAEQSTAERVIIPLIVKADVKGSLEGITHELEKVKNERVDIKVIYQGIGDVAESDVKLALSDPLTVVIGFNVTIDSKARALAERSAVEINLFTIIYKVAEHVQGIATARTPKLKVEEKTGLAKVIRVFSKDKDRQILGGKVQSGALETGSEVKILRRDAEIGMGRIRELQSQKVRVQEVREGFEFGTMVECKIEIMPGDKLEGFKVVEK